MNKRGFTLVEVLAVILLLGLLAGISVPNIMKSSTKAKERTLLTKIKNIEKAAVLYGQDNRHKINKYIENNSLNKTNYPLCFKNGSTHIPNCYYYINGSNTTITVDLLANPGLDEENNPIEPYINYDKGTDIVNPVDKNKTMKNCEIQIYQKYGKIYAVYTKTKTGNDEYNNNCWK